MHGTCILAKLLEDKHKRLRALKGGTLSPSFQDSEVMSQQVLQQHYRHHQARRHELVAD